MHELRFAGKVVNGIGRHSELVIPGRGLLPGAPLDWPERLIPGSLNLFVSQYPDEFGARGLQLSTKALDTAGFEPAFTIDQNMMANNMLYPSEAMANRGTAQVWRASLQAVGRDVPCWVLRRFGSGLFEHLELVSAIQLRCELGLSRDKEWPAVVRIFGHWKNQRQG